MLHLRLTHGRPGAALAFIAALVIAAGCESGTSQVPSVTSSPGAPSPTTVATAAPTATPTLTPAPTQAGPDWTGLLWTTTGVLPPEEASISDIVAWQGGYVGVGWVEHHVGIDPDPADTVTPAFFTSPDGTHWAIDQLIDRCAHQPDEPGPCGVPQRVMTVAGGLLMVTDQTGALCEPYGTPCGVPMLWFSSDGTSWAQLESGYWEFPWEGAHLVDVAGGPAGVVAIGVDAGSAPVILSSTDARTWSRTPPTGVFDHAVLRGVAAFGNGFAIVGSVGEPDPLWPQPLAPTTLGRPAGWVSADGLHWRAADVDGTEVPGGMLQHVGAGADGLFALGFATTAEAMGTEQPTGWASRDGVTWRSVDPGDGHRFGWILGSDGTHLVTFASGPGADGSFATTYWASRDGTTWTPLMPDRPTWVNPIDRPDGLPAIRFWVVPKGLIASVAWNQPQAFSFGTALTGETPVALGGGPG
jgi:hypothetical protein